MMKNFYLTIIVLGVTLLGGIQAIDAAENISVTPARVEKVIVAGRPEKVEIRVSNTLNIPVNINLSSEDIEAGTEADQPVILLGNVRGEFSAKDFLKSNLTSFELEPGQSKFVPITIDVPRSANTTGHYGAVIFTITSKVAGNDLQTSGASLHTRLGVVFLLKPSGAVASAGTVTDFDTINRKHFYTLGSVSLFATFKNDGDTHLNPYGLITFKNIFGMTVDKKVIMPTFVLPQSTRTFFSSFSSGWHFGYYSANLQLNRGYGDIVDNKTVSFIYLSWQILLIGVLVLSALLIVGRQLKLNYRLSKIAK